jgi:hypothetical protein
VIEPTAPHALGKEAAEDVIALGRCVYPFYRRSPELLTLDPSTLWRVIHDSYADDGERRRLLEDFADTSTWTMAVRTAQLLREVYETGGLDEEPA